MNLTIQHKEGPRQFDLAMDYFRSVISDTVAEHRPDTMECQHYNVTEEGQPVVPMHIWQPSDSPHLGAHSHVQVMYAVANGITCIQQARAGSGLRKALAKMPLHLFTELPTTFFLEVLEPEGAFTDHERTRLLIGVVENDVAFVSTDALRMVRLEDGLYGMAVQDNGSYLVHMGEQHGLEPAVVHHRGARHD